MEMKMREKKCLNGRDRNYEKPALVRRPVAIRKAKINNSYLSLEQSENRFAALIQQGSDIISIINGDGSFKWVSHNSTSVLGLPPEHFLNKFFFDFIHPEDVEHLQREFEDLKKRGEQKQQIFRMKNKDGNWRWMEARARDLRQEPGIDGIVVNTRDITTNYLSRRVLEESEEKYRAFFQNSIDGILLTAPTGEIYAANPAACRMFQRSEQELCEIGREGVVDHSDPRLRKALELRRSGGRVTSELSYVRKDGTRFPVQVSSSTYKNANGEDRSCVVIRDVTHQKQVEEELRRSRELYKSLFEYSPLPNWIYDNKTFRITDVNKAAIEEYGYARDEFLNLKITDLKPRDEVSEFVDYRRKIEDQAGTSLYGKVKHLTKSGELKIKEILSYRFPKTNNTLVVSQDLTEWEKVQERLQEKRKKLLTAQRIGKMGYWQRDFRNETLFWTQEVYNIWERDKTSFDLNVQAVYETVHPEDLGRLKQEQELARSAKSEMDLQYRILLPDGRIKWVHVKGQPLADPAGEIIAMEGTIQDITESKTVLENLQISEARQASLLQSQTNYLVRIDLRGKYSYGNKKFRKDFGWMFADGEIIGKDSITTVKEYHQEMAKSVFHRCIENPNTVFQIEIDKVRKNGQTKPTLWDYICITNSFGEPTEVQGVGIDITSRVKAENELKEINKRYELVTKATSDAIWDWNAETNHLFWGQGFRNLFGYETSDSYSWHELIHPEDATKVLKKQHQVMESSEDTWEERYRFRKADGEYAHVRDRSYIVRDKKAKVLRMVGAMQDVTQEKLWVEKLVQSEARHFNLMQEKERILESIGDGFFTLDHNWVVTYWNAEAERLLECARDRIIGRKLFDFFDIRNTAFESHYLKAMEEKENQNFEAYFEGTGSWYEVSAYPSSEGISVFFKDVTRVRDAYFRLKELNNSLKNYTNELVAANKGLEQFSFIVSHNLRAPVANIIGLATLLENKEYPEEIQREMLEGLTGNAKRLDGVMSDLNHILQVKNQFNEKKELVNIPDLVLAIQAGLQTVLEKEEVKIVTDFSQYSELLTVRGYIHSIFHNLIFNSIKYRRLGVDPWIKISTRLKEGKVLIHFEDNGIGIDLEKQKDQIFGLYKRFHHHVEGKGMGLYMVKTQVEMLGGRISVSSQGGEGTTFTIEFRKADLPENNDQNETVHSN